MYSSFCKHYVEVYGITTNKKGKTKPAISWEKFQKYWDEQYPQVRLLKKKTDFCELCCKTQEKLNNRPWRKLKEKLINSLLMIILKSLETQELLIMIIDD